MELPAGFSDVGLTVVFGVVGFGFEVVVGFGFGVVASKSTIRTLIFECWICIAIIRYHCYVVIKSK